MGSCRIAGGLAMVWWAVAGGLASGQTISRLSLTGSGAEANGGSGQASVSADGRFVAFASSAANLVPDDTNGAVDVFVKDRQTGAVTRVSVRSDGSQADGGSVAPSISADGRFVAFVSSAALVGEDNNGPCSAGQVLLPTCADIYVHDRVTGDTTRASDKTQADGPSGHPHISGDGRYVVFDSSATNLVPGDTNLDSDIFVRDRTAGTTSRVSVTTTGIQTNHAAYLPTISDDGQIVLFLSLSTNLDSAPDSLPCPPDVVCSRLYLHTMANGVTTRAALAGMPRPKVTRVEVGRPSQEIGPAISRDGTTILTSLLTYGDPVPDPSYGTFLVSPGAGDAVVYTIATQQTRVIDTVDATGVSASANGMSNLAVDGRGRTFAYCAYDRTALGNVMSLKTVDALAGRPQRVPPGTANLNGCRGTSFSSDGTLLTLALSQADLVSGDTNATSDVLAVGHFTRYLAEGVINEFFSTYINVFNPSDVPALVQGRYLGQNGNVTTSVQTAPPHESAFLNIVAPDQSFSTVVESDAFLAIERTVVWPRSAPSFYGSHAEAAIDLPRTTWYFAEGATHGQLDLFYLLQNPGATDTSATITYLLPAPQPPIVRTYTVAAHSRLTIWVDQDGRDRRVGEDSER